MAATREDIQQWLDAGLLDAAIARRILDFESEQMQARRASSGRPGVLELLVYLAAAVTAVGFTILAGTNWEHLPSAARIALPGAAAVVVLAASYWLRQQANEGMIRAASLPWLLAG